MGSSSPFPQHSTFLFLRVRVLSGESTSKRCFSRTDTERKTKQYTERKTKQYISQALPCVNDAFAVYPRCGVHILTPLYPRSHPMSFLSSVGAARGSGQPRDSMRVDFFNSKWAGLHGSHFMPGDGLRVFWWLDVCKRRPT